MLVVLLVVLCCGQASRLAVNGTGMMLEAFFSRDETAQIVHSLSVAPFLFAVPRADNALHAVGALQVCQAVCVRACVRVVVFVCVCAL